MKGVIASIAPEAEVLDLSHEVSRQNVVEGALLLADSARFFPSGSIFVCVVDPGVGSKRRCLAMESGGRIFLGPDNGLLHPVAGAGLVRVVELTNAAYRLPDVSPTFHGRDIFAPAAAHLWNGVPLSDLGPAAVSTAPLEIPAPRVSGRRMDALVLFADRFGNLVTNASLGILGAAQWTVEIKGKRIGRVRRTYSDVPEGRMLALIGSSGRLEISVRGGSALERLHLRRPCGFPVRLFSR
jgi:S-adenosylmethionine hydrolase